ncbi:MAG: HAD-IA family hydrolase [Bryobacteraceae bacterium]
MAANQHTNGGRPATGAAIPAFAVYLFDVDGTLLDSAPDICGALQTVLASTTRADVSQSWLKQYVGYHLTDLFHDLFPEVASGEIERLILEYRAAYPARDHRATTLYPGVVDAMSRLPGRKSTATTKGTPTTTLLLERFGLLPFFDHVQGTDGFPSKPEPDVVLRSLEALDASPEDCLFVGDSAPDMEAGRRAGVTTCAVRYGYGNQERMAQWRPDYWIDDLRQLLPGFNLRCR